MAECPLVAYARGLLLCVKITVRTASEQQKVRSWRAFDRRHLSTTISIFTRRALCPPSASTDARCSCLMCAGCGRPGKGRLIAQVPERREEGGEDERDARRDARRDAPEKRRDESEERKGERRGEERGERRPEIREPLRASVGPLPNPKTGFGPQRSAHHAGSCRASS